MKRIITKKNFGIYIIPSHFGKKAEIIILPYSEDGNKKTTDDDEKISSYDLMKLQESSKSIEILNEPEEDAWDER